MSRLGFAIASAMLLASTSAYAQITGDIGTEPSGSAINFNRNARLDPHNLPTQPTYYLTGTGSDNDGGYGRYQTDIQVGETISFKAANLSMGPALSTFSTTSVSFDFTNPNAPPGPIFLGGRPPESFRFESTIIPAGMGFQVIDLAGVGGSACPSFDQCSPVHASAYGFDDFGYTAAEATFTLAQVGFNFDISDNGNSIYNVSGAFELQSGPGGLFFDDGNLYGEGSADAELRRFHRIGDLSEGDFRADGSLAGFEWGTTAVHFDLSGRDHHLVYTTSVFSYSDQACLEGTTVCLVGYAGFGDPIGRGGGVLSASLGAFAANSAIPGGATFNAPTYDAQTNTLGFVSTDAAVPEPASWALMILGFGGIGAAMRRRRMLSAHA